MQGWSCSAMGEYASTIHVVTFYGHMDVTRHKRRTGYCCSPRVHLTFNGPEVEMSRCESPQPEVNVYYCDSNITYKFNDIPTAGRRIGTT